MTVQKRGLPAANSAHKGQKTNLIQLGYPPRQAADTLSMKKAIEETMKKMESPNRRSN